VDLRSLRRSKALESAGDDPDTRTLRVQFRRGKLYDYAGVAPEVFEGLITSAHPWTDWGDEIKRHPATRV
jgi:hypothetical protein